MQWKVLWFLFDAFLSHWLLDFDIDTVDFYFVSFAVDSEDFTNCAFASAAAHNDLIAFDDVPALEGDLQLLVRFDSWRIEAYEPDKVHFMFTKKYIKSLRVLANKGSIINNADRLEYRLKSEVSTNLCMLSH